MKNIIFLIIAFSFLSCSSSKEDENEKWKERRIEYQNQLYDELINNISGNWKEYMYINFMGDWDYSSKKGDDYIEEFTFYEDETCTRKNLGRLHEYSQYTINKNPDFINPDRAIFNPCCIIIRMVNRELIDEYSAWIDEEGYLRITPVYKIEDYKATVSKKKYKKQ